MMFYKHVISVDIHSYMRRSRTEKLPKGVSKKKTHGKVELQKNTPRYFWCTHF